MRDQVAFWINYGAELHITGHAQYIIPLSLQALPAVILCVGMALSNESPRFLAQKSPEKALVVLARLRGLPEDHPYVRGEMEGIILQLEEERALFAETGSLVLIKEDFATRANRRRTILCVALMMWSNLTGTNAMTYYSPTIFSSIGMPSNTSSLLATGVYGIVKMITCAIFILFVSDTLGRRKSLLWTGVVQVSSRLGVAPGTCNTDRPWMDDQGLALFYVGFYIRFDPPVEGQISGAGYVALVAIYVFASAYQFGWGPAVWTICSVGCDPRCGPGAGGRVLTRSLLRKYRLLGCAR